MILVTGGLGFIGSHTTRALLDAGADILPASRTRSGSPLLPNAVEVAHIDCTDAQSLDAIGRRHRVTGIVHLAAAPIGRSGGSGGSGVLAELRQNTDALLTVLAAAARWNVGRVVVASSIGVYAGVETTPWREDAPLPVASPHPVPAAKKAAEILALASGPDVVVARIGGIWGPLGRPASPFIAAPAMIHAASRAAAGGSHRGGNRDDRESTRNRDGARNRDDRESTRNRDDRESTTVAGPVRADDGADILYAPDCAAALALLATSERLQHRVYNIGGGHATTNREVAAAIGAVSPGFRPLLAEGGGAPIPHLDTARIHGEGWRPRWNLDRAVADYLGWLAAGHER